MNKTTAMSKRVVRRQYPYTVFKNGREFDICDTESGAKEMVKTLKGQGHKATYLKAS